MALWSVLFSRPAPTPVAARPSLTLFFLLAGAFLLTLVPHVIQFPVWLSVTIVVAMVLRSIIEFYRLPLPSTSFCGFLALLLMGGIWWQFDTVAGREAGTAFTAGLLTLKFYELRRPRDAALIIFSCFFVVMSALLYSQVLELFIYCLIMMWVLTALLLRVHTGDLAQDQLLQMLGRSSIIFLQALPFALFLYFAFPRYTGTLSIILDESTIGLTDTVSPGSIAKLSQNDSEAMYVHFTSPNIPTAATMYWRALVLWDYRNGTWTPGNLATSASLGANTPLPPGADRINQEITIYRHNQKWLFALDVPVSAPINKGEPFSWAVLLNGNIAQLSRGKLDHTARYDVTSTSTVADEKLTDAEKQDGVRLPNTPEDHIDQQVKDLANRLHEGLSDGQEQDYIYKVLHYFRHNGFTYSTTPGMLGPDWLRDFLFKTKTGFCEHFASGFAVLMRLKGIPARLVVGYQGAEYNPYSDHYIVSQSNAHAWDEVWIAAKKHWVRVDPTALLTITEQAQSDHTAEAGDTLSIQVAHRKLTFSEAWLPGWARDSLKDMQLRREQVETDWDNLIFSYDPEAQNRLAQALGLGEQARFELLLVCLVAGGSCLIIFKSWIARKPPASPVENLYAAFCRKMAQRGIPRAAWAGPLAYTERVASAFPDDKLAIQRVGALVARTRYGPAPADPAAPHDLKSLLTLISASQAAVTSRGK